jgi:hypothetical protein
VTVDLPDGFGGKAVGFARWRQEIEARLRGLEKATPSINRDQKGGTSTVRDPDGNVRLVTGEFDNGYGGDGQFGILIQDGDGNVALQASDAGLSVPGMPGVARRVDDYTTVTSSTFTQTHSIQFPWASSDAVEIVASIHLPAGTSAEARLVPNWDTDPSAVQSGSGGGSGATWAPDWKWATPGLQISTMALSYGLEVRRTAGTGNVDVYTPTLMIMASSDMLNATSTGV